MKPSMFNIAQNVDGKILLYNTFTTSIVEITQELYQGIQNRADDFPVEFQALTEMGFFVEDDCDEVQKMESLRRTVLENSSAKFANIIIAPTLACNAHCYYCFENGYRNGVMSYETADALVDFLEQNWNGKKLGITWFGGEPLMGKNIITYVSQKLRERGIVYGCKITTNGSLLDEATAREAVDVWNVEKVQITVDAIGKEYNRIKNYDKEYTDAFSLVMQNIETALSAGIKVKIRINFDPEKQDKALEIMQYLLNRFSNADGMKIYFAPIDADDEIVKNITNEFSDHSEHPYISLIRFGRQHRLYRGFPDMEEEDDDYDVYDAQGLLKKLKIQPSPINCYASCPNVFSIAPNGDIYKCHRALGREEYASGNIKTGLKKNNAYDFFCNTQPAYSECEKCALLPICQGGCKMNARLYSGMGACAPSKAIIKDLILLYREDLRNLQLKGE